MYEYLDEARKAGHIEKTLKKDIEKTMKRH